METMWAFCFQDRLHFCLVASIILGLLLGPMFRVPRLPWPSFFIPSLIFLSATGLAHLWIGDGSLFWYIVVFFVFGVFVLVLAAAPFIDGVEDNHYGSAQWATLTDMIQVGRILKSGRVLSDSWGFALGRATISSRFDPRFRYMGHVLTCAPTGSGKGIGAVIPNLLEYPGSAIVLDIKGENYAVTANRRRALGHAVFLIDPFGVTGAPRHALNWLDRIDPQSPESISEAASLADMLVVPDGLGSDHWDDSAKDLIKGLILATSLYPEGQRHIGTVRHLLTLPAHILEEKLFEMSQWQACFGIVQRTMNAFLSKAVKERSSVLSTAIRHTSFLDDPRIVESLSRSDFQLAALKERPVTVYIAMAPSKLQTYNRFMRGCVGQALSAITSTQTQPPFKVAFFLDEFAQLGRMRSIEDTISLIRGYGAAFWIVIQDLSQLKAVYPKWQSFLANSAKQFFGTADYDTANYISDSLGQRTHRYETQGKSRKSFTVETTHTQSEVYHGRHLLNPDEVMNLAATTSIVLINGERPYRIGRLNYLSDSEYKGLFDSNPYYPQGAQSRSQSPRRPQAAPAH